MSKYANLQKPAPTRTSASIINTQELMLNILLVIEVEQNAMCVNLVFI